MKAPAFRYLAPATLAESAAAAGREQNARVLAGGQSLVAMLNMRFAFPDCLIDINRVAELAYLRESDGGIEIGAMTRQRDLEFSPLVARRLPLARSHPAGRASPDPQPGHCRRQPVPAGSVRRAADRGAGDGRRTDGGQRAHERRLRMADFFAGYMTPALEADEILTSIRVQPWPAGHGHAFLEFARRCGTSPSFRSRRWSRSMHRDDWRAFR